MTVHEYKRGSAKMGDGIESCQAQCSCGEVFKGVTVSEAIAKTSQHVDQNLPGHNFTVDYIASAREYLAKCQCGAIAKATTNKAAAVQMRRGCKW